MDIEKHLIIIKGEDKTDAISQCVNENGKWKVQFERDKTYTYNYQNVKWLRDPVVLLGATTIVYQNNQSLSGVDKILVFGEFTRICFVTGYKKVYSSREITIEQSSLNNSIAHNSFEYLKQLAEKDSIANDEDSSFLSKQYTKITCVSPSSVLAKYLYPTALNKPQLGQMPIFPFGFNLSQKAATEKALTEQISVIEGPPGTGKTQTILNIIANAIMNGKTVAVVSNNNAATANILEKLQKYGVDFIAAYLGNLENKVKFFADQTQAYPDMTTWVMDAVGYNAMKKTLEASGNELRDMLEAKNEMAILKQELAALSVEKEYFKTYYNETNEVIEPYRSLYWHNSETVTALWLDYQRMAQNDEGIRLTYKLKNLLRYGIFSLSFYNNSPEKVIALFQKLYYDRKEKELNERIQELTKRLESYQFDLVLKKYSEHSMKLFKAKLAERFSKDMKRKIFTKDSLWKDFGPFIQEYPLILSTTYSLRTCASANYLFDYVIMDEASQVNIVTGALALSCAKNAVIVGDLMQTVQKYPVFLLQFSLI